MWIWIAVGAALAQTGRNATARSLSPHISPVLNSWSRFSFSLPYAAILLVVVVWNRGSVAVSIPYFTYCLLAATTQLLGNVALVAAFRHANFAESIVYLKLEVLMTAVVGALLFAEMPTILGWLGVFLCALGVIWMNLAASGANSSPSWRAQRDTTWSRLTRWLHWNRGALLALSAGMWLVMASFMLKAANTQLVNLNPRVGEDRFEVASHTLFHVIWIEALVLTTWIVWRRRDEIADIREHVKPMLIVGLTSFLGSLGWFWAFSLTLVAYVKAVGQLEAVFAVGLSLMLWREQQVIRQIPGIVLIVVGIAMILFG